VIVKLLVAASVIIAVLTGAYVLVFNKPVTPSSVSKTVQETVQKVQPVDTSDAELDNDMTALEKDLAAIEASEVSVNTEIQ